ncbi:RNA-guided endonuclease InsQ/TnpB family protein [Brevibacillus daliensis]|uniref:RNA-guided endonuclease InsQ/TnpB family protein n=1 Tax=Brevibacillus daliensis TaxID=2892995 RepID=UPI001E56A3D6|nr:transposase [Brevibacillus daliensis]
MILAKKVRIKPTKEQELQLWKSVGTARWAYNWTLSRQEENYRNGGKFLSDGLLRKELTQLKQSEEYAWLYDVSNNVTKQAVKDACEAYKKFFKKLSDEPRFKSRKHSKPSFYNDTDKLKVKRNLVLIEKVGWVQTSEQLPVDVMYVNPRISFDGKYWYLSVGIEKDVEKPVRTEQVIGIDVGVKDLAVCSNGMTFKNINKSKAVKKVEKRLRRLQRKVSRKYEKNKEGNRFVKTCNIVKVEKFIRLLHRRLTNIRTNHIHQATNAIVKTKPSTVVMETLNITGIMKNRHLSKAIAKQKLYEFKRQLQYKCEKYDICFMEADRWYPSSKTCSGCSQIKKDLKLSDRVFKCGCGLEIDRDLNAAINLAKLAS